MNTLQKTQALLVSKTRRWWFFLCVFLSLLIAPYASKNFDTTNWGTVISRTLGNSLFNNFKNVFPIFQIIAIVVFLMVPLLRNRSRVVLSLHAGFSYMLFAVLQNIAITPQYGLSIVLSNIILFMLVAVTWFWEALVRQNDFSSVTQPFWKYLVLLSALFAFLIPINLETGGPGFFPAMFSLGSALAFCPMTPMYLAILIYYYPKINILTLRMTSIAGIIIGFFNVLIKLILQSDSSLWDGILHLPLFILSILGLILSMIRIKEMK